MAWALAGALVVVAVSAFLDLLFARMALAAVAAFVAITPAIVERRWTRMVPWPLLLICAIPLSTGALGSSFFTDIVTGLSIAALGMLVVVAFQSTGSVRMTPNFAVFFVVFATLATAGLWAILAAGSAYYFDTAFVETNEELMITFNAAALAALVAGGVFRLYFRRQLKANVARVGGEGVSAP